MLFNKIKYGIRTRLGIDKMTGLIDTSSQLLIVVCLNDFIVVLNVAFTPSRY